MAIKDFKAEGFPRVWKTHYGFPGTETAFQTNFVEFAYFISRRDYVVFSRRLNNIVGSCKCDLDPVENAFE